MTKGKTKELMMEKVLISDEIKSEFRREVYNFMNGERNLFHLRQDAKALVEKFKEKNNLNYRQIERLLYSSNENFHGLIRRLYTAKALFDAGDLNDN
jgi:hypothetical protein